MEVSVNQVNRLTNMDLLRMISMYFVLTLHYIFHGVKPQSELTRFYQFDSIMGVVNWITMESLYVISTVAVNCFVMISGYFLIQKRNLRWNGIIKIWAQTLFYSIVFLGISFLVEGKIGVNCLVNGLLPIFRRQYWFIGIYIGLMFVAPFLSRLAQSLNKREYLILLGILFIMNFQYLYGEIYGGWDTLLWFIFLYFVAGYILLWGIPEIIVTHKGGLVVLCLALFVGMSLIVNVLRGGGGLIIGGPIFRGIRYL